MTPAPAAAPAEAPASSTAAPAGGDVDKLNQQIKDQGNQVRTPTFLFVSSNQSAYVCHCQKWAESEANLI